MAQPRRRGAAELRRGVRSPVPPAPAWSGWPRGGARAPRRRRPPRGRDQPGSASSPGKAAHPSVAHRLSQASSGSCFRRRARCRLGARCQTAVAQPVRKDLAAEGPVHEERGCRPQAQAAAARTRRRASSSSETSSPSSVATSSGVSPAQTRATLRVCRVRAHCPTGLARRASTAPCHL